jgi:hypothetical protein
MYNPSLHDDVGKGYGVFDYHPDSKYDIESPLTKDRKNHAAPKISNDPIFK